LITAFPEKCEERTNNTGSAFRMIAPGAQPTELNSTTMLRCYWARHGPDGDAWSKWLQRPDFRYGAFSDLAPTREV